MQQIKQDFYDGLVISTGILGMCALALMMVMSIVGITFEELYCDILCLL